MGNNEEPKVYTHTQLKSLIGMATKHSDEKVKELEAKLEELMKAKACEHLNGPYLKLIEERNDLRAKLEAARQALKEVCDLHGRRGKEIFESVFPEDASLSKSAQPVKDEDIKFAFGKTKPKRELP